MQPFTHVVVTGVEVRELVHVLFGNEVQHLGHMPVLDDGHAFDRALAFHSDAVHTVALAVVGAAQFAQTVEIGQVGHCVLVFLNRPTEMTEAPQVDPSQGPRAWAHSKKKKKKN